MNNNLKRIATGICALVVLSAAALNSSAGVDVRTLNDGRLILEDIPDIPRELEQALHRYQNTRSAPFQCWSGDSRSVYISTRFGDVYQIHRVAMAGGARRQLTFAEEPIGEVLRRPRTESISYTMDTGGSENSQIFLLDPASGESRMLTDGKSRNDSILWSGDGARMAFRSTRRNDVSNDIWVVQGDDPGSARIAVEVQDGSWWSPGSWSEDGRLLLSREYVSTVDARVHLTDLASGETRLLEGGGSTMSYNAPAAFGYRDRGYFFITNQFSEFRQLAYREFENGKTDIITRDINWDVDGFVISEDRRRAAFRVNEEGFASLYLLDTRRMKFEKVSGIPPGRIAGFDFSPDGRRLAMTLSHAQSPSDTFVMELGRAPTRQGEITRWTFSETGGLDVSRFVAPELFRYASFDQRSIPAFIYKPGNARGKLPVIISIHGGPEAQWRPGFRSSYQLWLDQLGAAVIAPNVRGSSGYGKEYVNLDNGFRREDSVKDIGALLDWIAAQPDLDAGRVAVIGGSYGGYMVLASAAHYSDRLKAAVDIVGISNFVTFLENTRDYRKDLRRVEYGDERDPAMRAHLEKISPDNHVDSMNIPMLVVQGNNDPRVPVTEAEQIVRALRENAKPVWYMNALNEGHGYRKKENRDVYSQVVVMFLRRYL